MAMTSQVTTWRVNPGRGADFLTGVAEAKKLHLKMGADQVWVIHTVSGGNAVPISDQLVFESAVKWGKFADAARSYTAWLAFMAKYSHNPSA